MRRRLIFLLALAMLAGLAGCGAEPETAPELASDGRRILTLGIVNSVPEARVLASLFNAQNKGYKIKIEEYKYGGSGKTPDDLTLELATGKAPDILVTETDKSFESAQTSGMFVELSGLLDELAPELVPCMFEALKAQDAVYALPYEFEVWTFLTQPSRVNGPGEPDYGGGGAVRRAAGRGRQSVSAVDDAHGAVQAGGELCRWEIHRLGDVKLRL